MFQTKASNGRRIVEVGKSPGRTLINDIHTRPVRARTPHTGYGRGKGKNEVANMKKCQ